MKTSYLTFLFLLSAVTYGQAVPTFSSIAPSSLGTLAEAKIFALAPVGYAGQTSDEERKFKEVFALGKDRAISAFETLYASGNPQAMSYAMVAMRKLDRKRYEKWLVSARGSTLHVTTMWGCVIESERLRKVADDLDSGNYDSWLRWMDKT